VLDTPDDTFSLPVYHARDSWFLEMVHVALKLRSDIVAHPEYLGYVISEEEALGCIPDSVYMFLKLLTGGQTLLAGDDDDSTGDQDTKVHNRVLSIGQDMVFSVSKGRRCTL